MTRVALAMVVFVIDVFTVPLTIERCVESVDSRRGVDLTLTEPTAGITSSPVRGVRPSRQ